MPDGMDFGGRKGLSLPAPSSDAPFEEREAWARAFVTVFIEVTGGETLHPDGGPDGYRWRMEFPEALRDPQTYQRQALSEIEP